MYINDKEKCFPLMGRNLKLKYDAETHDFDIYSYYWDQYWCWVKDEYAELPDEELSNCENRKNTDFIKIDSTFYKCRICEKFIKVRYS